VCFGQLGILTHAVDFIWRTALGKGDKKTKYEFSSLVTEMGFALMVFIQTFVSY
jgi:hypothetical protein